MSPRRRVLVALSTLLACASLPLAAGPAFASNSGTIAGMQVGVNYSVYAPTTTLGLSQTDFTTFPCPGQDEGFVADFGQQGRGRNFSLQESAKPCLDGPDGVGPVTTITVKGATATIMGQCAGSQGSCSSATRAGLLKNGYTTVTLPSAPGTSLTSTTVALYTQGYTVKQIRRILAGLAPVLKPAG